MLSDWLKQQVRIPQVYKFPVTDVTELVIPDEKMIDYLARALLLNHADPLRIQDEYIERIKDAEDSSAVCQEVCKIAESG
jgi:hypothetical protein